MLQTGSEQEVLSGIKQILERLEKKIDIIVSQLPQSTDGVKTEGSGQIKSPLKVQQEHINEKFITLSDCNKSLCICVTQGHATLHNVLIVHVHS